MSEALQSSSAPNQDTAEDRAALVSRPPSGQPYVVPENDFYLCLLHHIK